MRNLEVLRWCGSIGIFYVLVPLYLVVSDSVLSHALAMKIPSWRGPAASAAYTLLVISGLALVIASIRAQIVRGHGHPFDLTGQERFSRPTRVLLTDGVYALCRNPMGLGDVLLYAGITGLAGALWSMAIQVPAYALVVVANHRINELPALRARFSETYPGYERRTPRLLPTPASLIRALKTRARRRARIGPSSDAA